MSVRQQILPVQAMTSGPRHHFFGYYDKTQWNRGETMAAAMEVGFIDRSPEEDDALKIGVIAPDDRFAWVPVGVSRAWHWQQGCMLQWLPSSPADTLIWNDRRDGRFVAVIHKVRTGEERVLPRPVYAVSPRGDYAISVNFARIHRTRPGYGYPVVPDPGREDMAPADDGLYKVDLATGASSLIVTYDQIANLEPWGDMAGAEHWFNHIQISRTGERFAFLHRWRHPGPGRWLTRIITADPDGRNLHLLPHSDVGMVSHYDWRDGTHILAWMDTDALGTHFLLMTDETAEVEAVGVEEMVCDGHCSFSPEPWHTWILNDTYPNAQHERGLYLVDTRTGVRTDIGRFFSPPELAAEIRCDLHPRWDRTGARITFDSAHEGQRQIYMIDVSTLTGLGGA